MGLLTENWGKKHIVQQAKVPFWSFLWEKLLSEQAGSLKDGLETDLTLVAHQVGRPV